LNILRQLYPCLGLPDISSLARERDSTVERVFIEVARALAYTAPILAPILQRYYCRILHSYPCIILEISPWPQPFQGATAHLKFAESTHVAKPVELVYVDLYFNIYDLLSFLPEEVQEKVKYGIFEGPAITHLKPEITFEEMREKVASTLESAIRNTRTLEQWKREIILNYLNSIVTALEPFLKDVYYVVQAIRTYLESKYPL